MADFAAKSQPHNIPPALPNSVVDFEVVDFKVVDPLGDPNAPIFSLRPGQAFRFVLKVKGTGSVWTGSNLAANPTWETKFFADALARDVAGEIAYPPVTRALTLDTPPNTYRVELDVPTGIATDGVYEVGALVRLPGNSINGFADEYHLDVAAL
jgi:hypothetical protein